MAFLTNISCDRCLQEKEVLVPSGHILPSICDDCKYPEPTDVDKLIAELKEEFQDAKLQIIRFERRLTLLETLKG